MKKLMIVGAGLCVALLLFLMVVSAVSADVLREQVVEWNKMAVLPVEVIPAVHQVAREYGMPWQELAAYLDIVYQDRIPVPTRRDLVPWVHIDHDPPVTLADVEPVWREKVVQWLRSEAARLSARPLKDWIPVDRQKEFADKAEALEMWETINTDEPDAWKTYTEAESYLAVSALKDWQYSFPVDATGAQYSDDWGNDRPQNEGYASTHHQGTDLFIGRGTAIVSVCPGTVVEAGWNYLGGWSATIQSADLPYVRFYYAHMNEPPAVTVGQHVEAQQVIGHVGTSGEGPPGTSDHISEPHLHFGMYMQTGAGRGEDWYATDPYPYLRHWDKG